MLATPDELRAQRWLAQADRDALEHIAKDIPDPAEYARYTPLAFAAALTETTFHKNGWIVPDEKTAALLRPYGLVEYGGRYLTAFGMKVRKALLEEMA